MACLVALDGRHDDRLGLLRAIALRAGGLLRPVGLLRGLGDGARLRRWQVRGGNIKSAPSGSLARSDARGRILGSLEDVSGRLPPPAAGRTRLDEREGDLLLVGLLAEHPRLDLLAHGHNVLDVLDEAALRTRSAASDKALGTPACEHFSERSHTDSLEMCASPSFSEAMSMKAP